MSLPVLVVALSLAGALGSPAEPSAAAPLWLAQDDRLEEDFGDPPPPPPIDDPAESDPSDVVGDAPPLPPPPVADTPAAPAGDGEEDDEDRGDGADDDEGDGESSVLLTRSLQYGAGFGTLAACSGLGCCGIACLTAILQPYVFSVPLLIPCVSALFWTALGGGGGAAAGAVEVLLGNSFGPEEADILWPTLATAGAGAGVMALSGGATLVSAIVSPSFGNTQPGNLQFTSPVTCLLSSVTLALCGTFCLAVPLVGLLTYGSVAAPKDPAAEATEVSLPPQGPALASAVSAMAF